MVVYIPSVGSFFRMWVLSCQQRFPFSHVVGSGTGYAQRLEGIALTPRVPKKSDVGVILLCNSVSSEAFGIFCFAWCSEIPRGWV